MKPFDTDKMPWLFTPHGAEHDRYSGIYIQLQNGLDYCTDEDDDEEDES